MHDCVGVIIGGGSNTLMDPCRSNIGGEGPDPCDPCGVDAYALSCNHLLAIHLRCRLLMRHRLHGHRAVPAVVRGCEAVLRQKVENSEPFQWRSGLHGHCQTFFCRKCRSSVDSTRSHAMTGESLRVQTHC